MLEKSIKFLWNLLQIKSNKQYPAKGFSGAQRVMLGDLRKEEHEKRNLRISWVKVKSEFKKIEMSLTKEMIKTTRDKLNKNKELS